MVGRLFLLCVLLCATVQTQAQQYQWVDEKGRVHYSDTPPAKAKSVRKTDIRTPSPVEDQEQLPFELQRVRKDFPVTLYTSPVCKEPCEMARTALNKRGVPFDEVQVWGPAAAEQLKSKTGSDKVPTLVVGRTAMIGFEETRFDGLLDSAGYPKQGTLPARSQRAPALPEGYQPPPQAKPLPAEATAPVKTGPYDTSGLKSNQSGKPGPYGLPDSAK